MHGGTRSHSHPEGGQGGRTVLDREHLANAQARIVVDLCKLLQLLGCYFTIENPHDSFLWHSAVLRGLFEFIGVSGCLIEFDQCAFGLQLRGLIATLSAANAFASTPMTFLCYHVIVRGFRRGIAMTTPGARSKSTGRDIRKLPRQDATQIHCAANGQRSSPTVSAGASCR